MSSKYLSLKLKNTLTCFALFFLSTNALFAKRDVDLNKGKTTQSGYFTVLKYELLKGKIIVAATIKGKVRKFILDTGAPMSISEQLYKELQAEAITKILVSDQGNKSDSLVVANLKEIQLGTINFQNTPALVINETNAAVIKCLGVDGFIGSNLLRNSIVKFSASDSTIIITDNADKLGLKKLKKYREDLMLDLQSGPYIWIKLKNKKKGKEQLLIDSGMEGFYDLSLKHFEILQPHNLFVDVVEGHGSNSVGLFGSPFYSAQYKMRVPEIKIGKAIFKNVSSITTLGSTSRLGSDLLKYGNMTIDYKNKKFYFEPFVQQPNDLYEKHAPLELTLKEGKLAVGIIWDELLKTKIAVGDEVISIDEVSVENKPICYWLTHNLSKNEQQKVTFKNAEGRFTTLAIEKK